MSFLSGCPILPCEAQHLFEEENAVQIFRAINDHIRDLADIAPVWHVFKALFACFVIGYPENAQTAAGYSWEASSTPHSDWRRGRVTRISLKASQAYKSPTRKSADILSGIRSRLLSSLLP